MSANIAPINPQQIFSAQERIAPYLHNTPLITSSLLNNWLGHEIIFKAEPLQKCGAFKVRGALNALLAMKERKELPERVVAYSSGNHAQAVAWAARLLGIKATVIIPRFVSQVKQQATKSYGAELILTDTRQETERLAYQMQNDGLFLLPPSDNDDAILGQGTACLEALQSGANPDAIFATCGGGSLLAGSWLATQATNKKILLFGAEPEMANDASRSFNSGQIFGFSETPMTIADGARTLRISERSFYYLQKLNGFYEATEEGIIYWTQWLTHLLKISVEPTSAVAMAAACQWLRTTKTRQRILIIISGGNVDPSTQKQIWNENYLTQIPNIDHPFF